MKEEIIMGGMGGQGILMVSRLLADAAILEGYEVTWYALFEATIRGGETDCFVILASERVRSPMVLKPSSLIAMSTSRLKAFEPMVRSGGILVVNSSLVSQNPSREDLKTILIPASEIATKMGDIRTANLVALGAYLREAGVVSLDSVSRSLKRIVPQRSHHLIPLNELALRQGFEYSLKEK